jgi:hypothetical protein
MNFFEKLKKEMFSRIQILALRPKYTPTMESNFEGDFDFIIEKQDFNIIIEIIYGLCKKRGINFTLNQEAMNKKRFEFFIHNKKDRCLILEFWTAVEFTYHKKRKFFSAKTIFSSINHNKISKPELLSLVYITHLFHKNKNIFSEENRYRFGVFLKNLSNEKLVLRNEVPGLLKEIQNKKLTIAEANSRALKLLNYIGIEGSNGFSKKVKTVIKRSWNAVIHLKRIVPIVGPDGVGKGSISEKSLAELKGWTPFRFKSIFRVIKPYRFIFYKILSLIFLFSRKKPPNSDIQPRNWIDESLSHYIFLAAFCTIRFLFLLKPTKRILLDRYFLDYFGSPIRYLGDNRYPKKIRLYKLLFFLTPVPKNMVFLGCTDASLTARKDELPIISVHFLEELYIEFMVEKEVPNSLFISTENSINISSLGLSDFLNEINRKK